MQEFYILKKELEQYKGTSQLVKIVEEHNKKWQESGLIKKIQESGLLKKEKILQIINDPGIIRKMAKQKLDLNGLQRLFLSITKLNAGQSTADFSRLLTGNTLLNGLNTGIQMGNSGNKSIDLFAGSQRTFNSIMDI